MNSIDLSPLYRSSIGFDRLATLLDNAMSVDNASMGYPPYNIEVQDDNNYVITLAVAGFSQEELSIEVERGVLVIKGSKADNDTRKYLHQGIANRKFERKFSLADYIEVVDAKLDNGLLTIQLVKEVPESLKPRQIEIKGLSNVIEHKKEEAHH